MWKKAKNIFSFQKIFAENFERPSEIFPGFSGRAGKIWRKI